MMEANNNGFPKQVNRGSGHEAVMIIDHVNESSADFGGYSHCMDAIRDCGHCL